MTCARAVLGAIALGLVVGSSAADAAELSRTRDYDYDPPAAGSYRLPVIKAAADGSLVDSAAKPATLRDLTGGQITVLSFIYTRCGDATACPYASSVLNRLHNASLEDPVLRKNLRLVSMSFDPEYDTPKQLATYASYVRDDAGGCEWRFVAPRSVAEVPQILSAYGQAVNRKAKADGTGPLYHTLRIYLIDRARRIRNIYSTGTLDPRLVLADIRTLLLEEKQISTRDDKR